MTTAEKLIKDITSQKLNIQGMEKDLARAFGNRVFTCSNCGCGSKLKNVIFVQTHWYEKPQGCMGGDNWYAGEQNLFCPKCGHRHRILGNDAKQRYSQFRFCRPDEVYNISLDLYEDDDNWSPYRTTSWYDRHQRDSLSNCRKMTIKEVEELCGVELVRSSFTNI